MVKMEVACRYCNQTESLVKAGYSISNKRYQCNNCKRYFQLEYSNNTCKLGVKEQIVEMAVWSKGYNKSAESWNKYG